MGDSILILVMGVIYQSCSAGIGAQIVLGLALNGAEGEWPRTPFIAIESILTDDTFPWSTYRIISRYEPPTGYSTPLQPSRHTANPPPIPHLTVHFISTTPAHGEETESHTKSALTSASTCSHAYAQRAAKGKVIYHQLDLGDLSAVKSFGEGFLETIGGKEKGLDLVVCNAGIGVAEYAKTKDGLACQ
jgi:hypothetical protein